MKRNPAKLVFILIGLALLGVSAKYGFDKYSDQDEGAGKDRFTMREMVGKWSDPNGQPGNYLEFNWQRGATSQPYMETLMGNGHVHRLFSIDDADFIFGFQTYLPLRLNISMTIMPAKLAVAELKSLSHDQLLVTILTKQDSQQVQDELFVPSQPIKFERREEAKYIPNWGSSP